jgi:parvulin-like peptidyl-prolyl isomerase
MLKSLKFAVAACLLLGLSGYLGANVVEKTVAIVNGEAIMSSDFEKISAPVLEQYKTSQPVAEQTPEKLSELKHKLLDQMIDDRMLKQEAKKQKIHVSKRDLEEGIKQVRKRFTTSAEFEAELKKEDLTQSQFEKRIEEQLSVMKLIEQEVKSKVIPPSEEEIKAFYDKVQQKMSGKDLGLAKNEEEQVAALAKYLSRLTSEQVRARHILIALDKNATMDVKSAALKKVKKVEAELKGGADIEELAKKYSDDPGSKNRGGDLGFFARGDMVAEFEKVAFSLTVGQVSEPVLIDFGYHIIKVEEKKAARKVTYNDIKDDLKELLGQKSAQAKYEVWMKDLKKKASIKINSLD